jgi:hypothetical protein
VASGKWEAILVFSMRPILGFLGWVMLVVVGVYWKLLVVVGHVGHERR